MSGHQLLLDRVEFLNISVRQNKGKFETLKPFPQLLVKDEGIEYLTRTGLRYPSDSAEDPRHFGLLFGVKVESSAKDGEAVAPYDIEVEAMGFFRYDGNEFVGEERFRCVRLSGYQILYGAIREMVANLTARGRHGMWQLPARNFHAIAMDDAKTDEADRLKRIKALTKKRLTADEEKPLAARKRKAKSTPATSG